MSSSKIIDQFDKTLTKQEREAETFLEWPDAVIARCVRATALEIGDKAGNKAMYVQSCINLMAAVMDEANSETLRITAKGDRPTCDFEIEAVITFKRKPLTKKK